MRDKMLALIRKHRPALLEGRVVESITDEQLEALVSEAMTPPPKVDPPKPADDGSAARLEEMKKLDHSAQVRESAARVIEALTAAATLPEIIKARVKKDLKDKIVTQDEIDARVKEEIEMLAAISKSGDVKGFGEAARVTMDTRDKVQAAVDRMFEIDVERIQENLKNAPLSKAGRDRILANCNAGGPVGGGDWDGHMQPLAKVRESLDSDPGLRFRGLKDFYVAMTGDEDITGRPRSSRRVSEALESTSWAEILANTLYRRMLMDYSEPEYNENSIATYGSAVDFRTKYITILGYFGDIAVVDPEAADYAEIAAVGDDQVSYAVGQRGNILTITRKLIINDDLRAVSKLVGRLGRSARRTLAKRIWQDNWVANIAYGVDSVAWFHTTHANTGSVALSADATGAAEVIAKVTQLGDMTEQGSGEKLGLPPLGALWLDVPHALLGVARTLNMTQYFGTTAANPVYQWFGAGGERINCNPLFTDATDWGVHMAPNANGREQIIVDFLQGRQEPELFLADMPTVGQMFYGDKLQYKIRHEYGYVLADFRGATKNVVAG